jgi:hypothetical protein
MDTNTLIQLATSVSVVIGVIGLLISVRAYKRQVSAYFFLAYTRRFDGTLQSLPLSVWAAHLFPKEALPASSDEVKRGILRCLMFVSQMHYFWSTGYIPKGVWKRSEGSFSQLLRSPVFLCPSGKALRQYSPPMPRFAGM